MSDQHRIGDKVETAVSDTFPASDPVQFAQTSGNRAVNPNDLMHPPGEREKEAGDLWVAGRFQDAEKAKLAVERVVRDGPVDRRRTNVKNEDGSYIVEIQVVGPDADRISDLLHQEGGIDV